MIARPELATGGGGATGRQIAEVYGSATIAGADYPLVLGGSAPSGVESSETGVKVETDRYNKAAIAKATVLADAEVPEDVDVEISIRDTPIFAGTVQKSKNGTGDRWRVTAYDAIYDLKRNSVWASYDQQKFSAIANDALATAGVDGTVELSGDADARISIEFEETRCDKVIEKVAKWSNGAWWVAPDGTVVVTSDIASRTETRDLAWIRDSSPGKETPAYQSVRVTGSTPVSRRGQAYRHMVSSSPVIATAGEGEPTFHYSDNDIQSQSMAQNTADKLLQRLQAQQKGGWVEVVGREDVRPFDTVRMPDRQGGEEYLVSEVKHTLDDSDGFVTKLTLGGLIEA